MVDQELKVGEWTELIGEDIQLKIIRPGEGRIAEHGELVRCRYTGRLVSDGKVFEVSQDTGYRIGDSDTTPALELGLRHMRKGNVGFIRCTPKYGYGPFGRKVVGQGAEVEVPPDAHLEYEAEVTDIYHPFNPKEAPIPARMTEASLKKGHGNGFFHHEDYTRAIRCYQSGLKALDPAEVEEEEMETPEYKEMIKLYCDMSNNLAAALMQLQRYKDAKEVCVKVIEVDPNNVKALYRGGVAAMRQDNYEEAELALKEAYKLAPTDVKVREAMRNLAQLKDEYREKEKKMYRRMSGFLNRSTSSTKDAVEGQGNDAQQGVSGGSNDNGEGGRRGGVAEEQEEEGEVEVEPQEGSDDEEQEGEDDDVIDGQAGAADAGQTKLAQKGVVAKLWAWYVRHSDWVVMATMILGPLIVLYPEIVKGLQARFGMSSNDDRAPPSSSTGEL